MKIKISLGAIILTFVLAIYFFGNIIKVNDNSINQEIIDTTYGMPLQVYFADVGQGDCQLIKFQDEYMLIDSGEEDFKDNVIDFLKSKNVTKIKYIIATHP
ncbi:MAG: hypothetical protein ACK5LC_14660, partial [Coprobacillaceae bacterium]